MSKLNRELVIGLDIGTTNVKAVMFNTEGQIIAIAEDLVKTMYPQLGWAEQNPNEVEQLARKVLKVCIEKAEALPDEILGVGLSTAMHSLICVDENGNPLSNMLIWSDRRSSEQAARLKSENQSIYRKTGTPIHPMSPLVKLMWMKDTGYEPYKKATSFMTIKDFLLNKWFGNPLIDLGMASSMGMLNLQSLDWDEGALYFAGIKRDQLSRIVGPTEIVSGLHYSIAEEIGIAKETPIAVGGSDGALANLGSGAILPGEVNISVGTSAAIRQFATGFPINENQNTFTYAFTEETSIIGGASNNGGIALQWAKDLFEFKGSFQEFINGAELIQPGSEGLFFHPFINGERSPLWNSEAKGNFYGFHLGHKREHVTRAVLEGISFNMYQISQSLEKLVGNPKRISINGGLSKSKLLVEMIADIFGMDIQISDTHHNAAWGAAWTLLVAIGKASGFSEIKEKLPIETAFSSDQRSHEKYQEIYQEYCTLLDSLVKHF